MAARLPKLSEEALRRIAEASRAEGLTPDAYILKFVPAKPKKKPSVQSRFGQAINRAKDPHAAEAADAYFPKAKPKLSGTEAGRLADEAMRKHRASKAYQKQVRVKADSMTVAEAEALFSQRKGGLSEREAGQIADKALAVVRGRRK